jgi:hypothetical protein
MNSTQQPYWFRAKRYGWGWGLLAAWQGWVVLVSWVAILLVVTPLLTPVLFYLFIAVMCALLLAICYAKGEPPRWRWGKE